MQNDHEIVNDGYGMVSYIGHIAGYIALITLPCVVAMQFCWHTNT